MNILLIFFALPIAVIIISAILQKVLKSPIAVAALIFAIFLVVTFAIGNTILLIATLAYTILAFITAVIVKFICEFNDKCGCLNNICNRSNSRTSVDSINTDLITANRINSNAINADSINANTIRTDTINTNTINTNTIRTGSNNNSCCCRCNRFRR